MRKDAICGRYCKHGGICVMHPSHKGLHKTGFCTFTEAEAVSAQEANTILDDKTGSPGLGEALSEWYDD